MHLKYTRTTDILATKVMRRLALCVVTPFGRLTGWPMDLKLGARMLAKTPGLTVVGVAALAIASAAGAAYREFSHDLLSPTLPLEDADRIVGIKIWDTERNSNEPRVLHDYDVWRGHSTQIEQLGASQTFERHLITDDGRTDSVRGVEISATAFSLMRTAPLLGRPLVADDEAATAPPVAVIGYDLWKTRFDGDPSVIGRLVHVGSVAHTIVGVMPDGFGFPVIQNLWTPLHPAPANLRHGHGPAVSIFGRLKEGSTFESAEAELQGMLVQAGAPSRPRVIVRGYVDSRVLSDRGRQVAFLLFVVNLAFVMLLALCGANVATLVFARTAMREGELTVRTALGASRGRIGAQLFAEALVLATVSALAALVLTRFICDWGKQLWIEATGAPPPFWWNDALSPGTILYVMGLAVLAAAIVGLIPAMKATGGQLQERLRDAAGAGSSMKFGRLWTGVIVMQAAITVVFVATAFTLARTVFLAQKNVDVTYAREQYVAADITGPSDAGASGADSTLRVDTLRDITERIKAEPGVINATYATSLPGTTWEQFVIEFPASEQAIAAEANGRKRTDVLWSEGSRVGPDFFGTFEIPLVAGRYFTTGEIVERHRVAIVDETFVRLILGGRNPLGLQVREAGEAGAPGPWYDIVGVVQDVTHLPDKGPEDAVVYRPADPTASIGLFVRTQGAAAPMANRIERAALAANADVRLHRTMTLAQRAVEGTFLDRLFLRVAVVFGAVALLLATAGIYALIAFTLVRRTREMAIRMALGAAPRRIITAVLSRAFVQVGLGVLAGALPAVEIIRSGAEDVGGMSMPGAAGVTLGICAFVVLVATIACATPVRRALRIEPTEALRSDA
jgi:putative ABC transport system permease protein